MNRIRRAGRQTFRSLETPNYRKYLVGQIISASGSWIQQTALTWLVVRMTHGNGFAVGTVIALQFFPVLIGGAWAGVLADRLDKRRLLIATSAGAAVCAAVMGALVLTGCDRTVDGVRAGRDASASRPRSTLRLGVPS